MEVMPDTGKTVGETIRELRKQRDLTQEDLGRRIGFSKSGISKIENGSAELTLNTLVKLAQELGVNLSYILRDTLKEEDYQLAIIKSFLNRFYKATTAKEYIGEGRDRNIDLNDPVLSLLAETTNPLVLQMDRALGDFIKSIVELGGSKREPGKKSYDGEIVAALRKLNKSKTGQEIDSYCFAPVQDIAEAIDKAAEIERTGLKSIEDVM